MTLVAPRKPIAHHKTRHGRHQKHSKHFKKTYWPYLPMLMIVGVTLAISNLMPAMSHRQVLGTTSDMSSGSFLNLTNQQRVADNETALSINKQLAEAAQTKAEDMAAKNYWSHNTPDGATPWSFIAATGYEYALAGENLAYGFSNANGTVAAWMNSAEHRANILNPGYTQVGFGVASSPDFQHHGPATIVVAMYAEPWNINFKVEPSSTNQSQSATSESLQSKPVARVQLLNDKQTPWSIVAIALITGGGLMLILIRHARFWHKTLVKSEAFVIKHPFFDIFVISLAAVGYILGQTAGFIQ